MFLKKSLKAFTIIELLVSMTLSGILVVFSFLGYNQIQKLFLDYSKQSEFISDYNQLNKALFLLSDKADQIRLTNETTIDFIKDTQHTILELSKTYCLLKMENHTDTFHLPTHLKPCSFIKIGNDQGSKLITFFEAESFFKHQKFVVSFYKSYDAVTILKLNQELLPKDELY